MIKCFPRCRKVGNITRQRKTFQVTYSYSNFCYHGSYMLTYIRQNCLYLILFKLFHKKPSKKELNLHISPHLYQSEYFGKSISVSAVLMDYLANTMPCCRKEEQPSTYTERNDISLNSSSFFLLPQ